MIIIICLLLLLLIVICYMNHRFHLKEEEKLVTSFENLVEIDGKKMNVYIDGNGEKTLVFLSGGGTSSPILDFKSLYKLLTKDYRIVVIEKFGYGFSDVVNEKRTIDIILERNREALKLAGVKGPYVLCPHSLSGLEAIYWAQIYPDEVEAIVGLDLCLPEAYENYPFNIILNKIGAFVANLGITRWIPKMAENDAIKYGTLSEEEKEIHRAIFYRRTGTVTMLNELEKIAENARRVQRGNVPNVSMLIFSSNGDWYPLGKEKWKECHRKYISQISNGQLIDLDCGHYIHHIEYERMALEIKKFLIDL